MSFDGWGFVLWTGEGTAMAFFSPVRTIMQDSRICGVAFREVVVSADKSLWEGKCSCSWPIYPARPPDPKTELWSSSSNPYPSNQFVSPTLVIYGSVCTAFCVRFITMDFKNAWFMLDIFIVPVLAYSARLHQLYFYGIQKASKLNDFS